MRPFEVVRGAGTREPTLRQDPGPLLGLQGATGHDPDTLRRIWVPSARSALLRPPGFYVSEQVNGLLRPPAPRTLVSLQRPIAAPPHRRGDPKARASDDASFPELSLPHDTYQNGGPVPQGLPAPRRATSEVWLPPSRPTPPFLRVPCGPRASTGFALRGVLLAPVGLPFGNPCPPAVVRVDSPRSLRCVRTRPASGP